MAKLAVLHTFFMELANKHKIVLIQLQNHM